MSRLAIITFLSPGGGDVDNTLPGGAPVYPSQGLPGSPAYPSQGLPWGPGHPGNALPPPGSIATLPVFPFDPTVPAAPDQDLPGGGGDASTKPIVPGRKFVVKWLACHGLILVPDNTLPEAPEATPK